jgi:hypothetical protein
VEAGIGSFAAKALAGASFYLGALLQVVLLRREMIAGMEALGAVSAIIALGAFAVVIEASGDGAWVKAMAATFVLGFLASTAADAWSRRRDEVPGERWQG